MPKRGLSALQKAPEAHEAHLTAGMETESQEAGTPLPGKAGGQRLSTAEQLDGLDLLRLLCRAALRLGRNTFMSSSSSSPDSMGFFKLLGNCFQEKSRRGKTHSSGTASLPGTALQDDQTCSHLLIPHLQSTSEIAHRHCFRQ